MARDSYFYYNIVEKLWEEISDIEILTLITETKDAAVNSSAFIGINFALNVSYHF